MSRTYRRKKATQEYYWVLREWIYHKNIVYSKQYDKHSKEGKRRIRVFHSDAQATMEQVPKWYKVYFCRKPFRRKEKEALYKAAK
ncbi:MAG: hypothetical protein GY936_11050, partial [Ignavibacteriae bacterium]|nr:hypothetical protein [Ignavibacteriota bacterium]